MKILLLLGTVLAYVTTLTSFSAHAVAVSGQGTWETTLQGRDLDGNAATFEAWYDTTLDITWLADANAAGTPMTWIDAKTWAAELDVNGITGWRLPTVCPVNGSSFNTTLSPDGTTDRGSATTTTDGSDGGWRDGSDTPVSEMGHMFYVTLGNIGACDPTLPWCTHPTGWGLSNTGLFTGLQADRYWFSTEFDSMNARHLHFNEGIQNNLPNSSSLFAWAVRSGDISAVPVPAAAWHFGSGLLGLIGIARRKQAA